MIILLHTSKTMRPRIDQSNTSQQPTLLSKARELDKTLKKLTTKDIARYMKVSEKLAIKTQSLINSWDTNPSHQRTAIDSFLGDIYSGLRVSDWNDNDRQYANKTLRILSGLYGILKPLDGIQPYRLEMGYKLPNSLYDFWGTSIAQTIPEGAPIINLAAVEYSKTVLPHIKNTVITPSFLTISPKTGDPTFVVVHAKIARGAFARWLIKNQIEDTALLPNFDDLNYVFNPTLSTPSEPVFVCKDFGGIGLSMRLTQDSAKLA